jgi:hypothetical protein
MCSAVHQEAVMVAHRLPKPSPSVGSAVYVPCCDIGIGTGTAAVRDLLSGQAVEFKDARLFLLGTLVCVKARLVEDAGPLIRVEFFDGRRCWTRPLALAIRDGADGAEDAA